MRKITYSYDEYDNCNIDLTECCGIEEFYGLSSDTNAVLAYIADNSDRRAMIIFHDRIGDGNRGEKLANKIRRLKLGKVIGTPAVHNPNSGNLIKMWTWIPQWSKVEDYRDRLKHDYYLYE